MKRLSLLIFLLMTVCCFALKAQNTDTTTYTNKKYHYNISLPKAWHENKADERGNKSFVGVSPSESDDDSFIENVTVAVTPNIDQSLKSYYKDRVNRIKFSVGNFKQKSDGEEEINGLKAKFIVYTFEYNAKTIEMIAYILVKNKTAYVISGMALESTYAAYKSKFQDIARSLVVAEIGKGKK